MVGTRKVAQILLLVTVTLIGSQYLFNVFYIRQHWDDGLLTFYKNMTVVYLQRTSAKSVSRPIETTTQRLEECPIIPPDIHGRLTVNTHIPSWAYLEEENFRLESGGRYHPPDCIARHRVAIIIPYRDREVHLKIFLQNLHPFLQKQQLDYGIYVVEMAADVKFNRALLMNIGFVEALKEHDYQCFIFHDVDLLPEDDRNLYTCPQTPRHMSVAIDRLNYKLPYTAIFGGVSAITRKQFETINGFSNLYFGWGGEDDDIYRRIRFSGMTVSRYSPKVARYKMLTHKKDNGNPQRFNLLKNMNRFKSEGLSSLKYTVMKRELKRLFTWVLVRVNQTELVNDSKQTKPIVIDKTKPKGQAGTPNVRKAQPPKRMKPLVEVIDWTPSDFKGVLPDYLRSYDIETKPAQPKGNQQSPITQQNKNSNLPNKDTDKTLKDKQQINQSNIQQSLEKQKIPRPPKVAEEGIIVPVFKNRTVLESGNIVPKTIAMGENAASINKSNVQYVIIDQNQAIPKPP